MKITVKLPNAEEVTFDTENDEIQYIYTIEGFHVYGLMLENETLRIRGSHPKYFVKTLEILRGDLNQDEVFLLIEDKNE